MTDPTAPASDEGLVRIIVAYDKDLSLVGTTRLVSSAEARQLVDEGRARLADGDPEDPDANPDEADSAAAESASADRAAEFGAFGAGKGEKATKSAKR
jgi:hypothetical protein